MSEEEPSFARILAFMMLDNMPAGSTNADKALRLSDVGFSNAAISEILGISGSSVSTTLHTARKKAAKKAPAKKAPAKKAPAKKAPAKKAPAKKAPAKKAPASTR